jgi:UTP--glucose-1-phosphate uridylyltransferase
MVRNAIIPAAGYGTRSMPITKVLPKEMLPICGRPAIDYLVEEA